MADLVGVNDTLPVRLGGVSSTSGLPDYYADVLSNGNLTVAISDASGNALASTSSALNMWLTGANDKSVTGTISANNQSVSIATSGYATCTVQTTGTWNGVVSFFYSNDGGTTWWQGTVHELNENGVQVPLFEFGGGTNDAGMAEVGGWTNFKVESTSWTSGTANITLNCSFFSQPNRNWALDETLDSISAYQAGTWNVNLANTHGTASYNWSGVGNTTLEVAAVVGNGSATADFGAGNSSANTLRVVVASNQAAIPVTQSTSPWLTKDNADGPVSPGTVASNSLLIGGQYNSSLPSLTTTQQSAIQLDSSGRLLIGSIAASLPAGSATIGAVTQASGPWTMNITQIGGSALALGQTTMSASIPVTIASNQSALAVSQSGTWTTGRTWTLSNSTDSIAAVQSGTWTVQPGNTANTTPWLVTVSTALPAGSNTIGAVTQASGPWTINLTEISGSALTLGQTTMSASVPVTIASNQSALAVSQSGTWTTGRTWTLASGTDSVSAVQSGTWTVEPGNTPNTTPWLVTDSADGPVTPGTVAGKSMLIGGQYNSTLPTLSSTQQSAIQLDSSGRILIGSIASALPSGSNTIGAVTQASGPWTINLTEVGGSALALGQTTMAASLPVTIASNQSALAVSQSGTWTVQQGTPPWQVVGNVASGSADSGNGVKGAGVFNTTQPTVTTGERVDFQSTSRGALIVATGVDAFNIDNITGTVSLPTGASTAANQATEITSLQLIDNPIGPVAPGTPGTGSNLAGGIYNSTLPSPTNDQQMALQLDYRGRLITAPPSYSYFHPVYTARVQSVTNFSTSNVTTLVATLTEPTKAGSLIVVYAAGTAHTITVTDSASQTYSTATTQTSGTNEIYTFYHANTSAGVTTVTITASTAQPMNMIVVEYSGIATTTPLDKTSTNSNAATSWTSNATTATTQAIELLIGGATDITNNATTFTAGTGWSEVTTVANTGGSHLNCFLEEQFTSVTGTYAATGTASAPDTILAAISTFKVATTPTGFTVPNAATTIKSGAGTLVNVVINTLGTGSASVTFYDNTTNSGTVIATISLTASTGTLSYDLNFTNGLTMVVNSITADFTVVYD